MEDSMVATPSSLKCLTLAEAGKRAAACRQQGQTVVFTNGCFDLLHAGHVRYLQAARAAGDVLFVGLNSDVSVQAIKDPGGFNPSAGIVIKSNDLKVWRDRQLSFR